MMRSMYSAVSGLKTHQTKMDVIGNNIANVNTVAFKSSSVTFQDILYQTTSGASGANALTGVGGVNAKQIGLGVSMAATAVSIETAGASETTGNPFDIKLTDKNTTNFFIVNDGSQNLFTRAGSFYVDGVGNLCMTSTGYTVMGWQVDETTNDIRKDTVSALRIMQEKNLTSAPEATTQGVMAGVLDENDADVNSDAGKIMNLNIYDSLGYQYTVRFSVKSTGEDGKYTVGLTSMLDDKNNDLIADLSAEEISRLFGKTEERTEEQALTLDTASIEAIVAGGDPNIIVDAVEIGANGSLKVTTTDNTDPANPVTTTEEYIYNVDSNAFEYVNPADAEDVKTLTLEQVFGANKDFAKIGSEDLLVGESYNLTFVEEVADPATPASYMLTHTYLLMNESTEKVLGGSSLLDPENMTLDETTGEVTFKDTGAVYTLEEGVFVNKLDATDTKRIDEVFNLSSETMEAYLGLGANPDASLINTDYTFKFSEEDGAYIITRKQPVFDLVFDTATGVFESINGDPASVSLNLGNAINTVNVNGNFENINIDFTQCLNYNNGGKSTLGMDAGAVNGSEGKGRKLGNMIGVSIDTNGKIYGSYDNGNTELLGQIAVAQFSNASGLSKIGESCYQTTLNSGDFDGIGVEVSADGSGMTTGELEMSNVDLSTEFTQMITTQRGFQANSRVITTSDSLLEELVNLKR